jgi:hypothetical protein
MPLELDMVVDANPANAPLCKAIRLCQQRVEVGPIELLEQCPRVTPSGRIGRSSLSCRNNSLIAVLSSARLSPCCTDQLG